MMPSGSVSALTSTSTSTSMSARPGDGVDAALRPVQEDVVLDVQDLHVQLPSAAGPLHPVRDVSFSVRRGELLAIIGESGCGKSMTANALLNLLPKQAKREATRLDFAGQSLLNVSERGMSALRGNRVALISQDPMSSFNPSYTIGTQLLETLHRHVRIGAKEARERAIAMLGRVGMSMPEARMRQYPHELSGGMRQRVAIAMALLCKPDLLIADEPTTALDVTIQAQVLQLLKSLQKEFGMSIVLITHDLGVVASVADRALVMYGGQVVEERRASTLFDAPLHPYTEGLARSIPGRVGTVPGAPLGTIKGLVPRPFGELVRCGFADRCPYVTQACLQAPVPLQRLDTTRAYRCLLPSDRTRNADVWLHAVEAA